MTSQAAQLFGSALQGGMLNCVEGAMCVSYIVLQGVGSQRNSGTPALLEQQQHCRRHMAAALAPAGKQAFTA